MSAAHEAWGTANPREREGACMRAVQSAACLHHLLLCIFKVFPPCLYAPAPTQVQGLMESYMRPGCTHLTLNALMTQERIAQLKVGACWLMHAHCSGACLTCVLMLACYSCLRARHPLVVCCCCAPSLRATSTHPSLNPCLGCRLRGCAAWPPSCWPPAATARCWRRTWCCRQGRGARRLQVDGMVRCCTCTPGSPRHLAPIPPPALPLCAV